MINKIRNFFAKKEKFSFSETEMKSIIEKNRKSLKKIESWIDEEAFEKSYYKYGVPDNIKHLLDLNIGNEVTYSDIIVYLSKRLKKVEYLELGVSVGKNFFQMAEAFENANIYGFDIENINPVLSKRFQFTSKETYQAKANSLRTEESSLTNYNYLNNSISYIAADIWDENTWARLEGKKFNIIFSDALHNDQALLWEYSMIEKYKLLDDNFLFMWDDLNNGLERSFYKIAEKIKRSHNLNSKNVQLIKINGWLGQNYPIKHDVGIITNLPIQ